MEALIMGIKNIHPHVGIDYTAKKRVRSVVTENTAATMFAPFVSNRGPENVAYKVYSNAEFISTYGQLEFAEQGQVVLNIGNWLNAGGAVLAYRMTKMPTSVQANIANNAEIHYLKQSEYDYAYTINGIVTTNKMQINTTTAIPEVTLVGSNFISSGNTYVLQGFSESNTVTTVINDIKKIGVVVNGVNHYWDGTIDSKGMLCLTTDTSKAKTVALVASTTNYAITYTIVTGETTTNYELLVDDANKFIPKAYTANPSQYQYTIDSANRFKVSEKFIGTDGLTKQLQSVSDANSLGVVNVVNNIIQLSNANLQVNYTNLRDDNILLMTAWGKALTGNHNIIGLARAKYSGSFYKNMFVQVTQTSKGVFKIEVFKEYSNGRGKNLVESFSGRTPKNYSLAIGASEYLGELAISSDWLAQVENNFNRTSPNIIRILLSNGGNDTVIEYGDKPESGSDNNNYYFVDALETAIKNIKDKLSIKCDFMLDAGYSQQIKSKIIDLLIKEDEINRVRDDIIFITDKYKLYHNTNVIPEKVEGHLTAIKGQDEAYEMRLLAAYEQYLTTEDIYSTTSGREVYVTPTYFLAGLIPYNERTHGVFYPHAGKRRGVINDALSLSENPLPDQKDEWYADRYNYIERDTTAIQFMSQSTFQQEDTALRFLNNSRSLNVISRNVERIGRTYLHEMNTVTSLNNLNAAITTYMNDWVQNRALSKCEVIVYADEYDDTLVHIILNIRFAGTIEIISVEINID
jgi:hypothetical protein